MTEELIPIEIHDTPDAIQDTLAETRPQAAKAAELLRQRRLNHIYLFGNGTSLYTSIAASYTGRTLARGNDPRVIAVPAGDFRHYPPKLDEKDAVVGVSASGEFRDVLAVFDNFKGRCLTVGITHVPGSSIYQKADFTICSAGGPSLVPVMTKTYASTLTAAHLLLMEYFQAGSEEYSRLSKAADICRDALKEADQRIPGIVEQFSKLEHGFYFGAGIAYASALEGALKLKEMALLHAEGNETWEMASGSATIVNEKSFCVSMTDGELQDEDTFVTARNCREWGARLLEIGPKPASDDMHLPVHAEGLGSFASLALVPPAALFAFQMARARGQNPDHPSWRDRYFSQGMNHILGE